MRHPTRHRRRKEHLLGVGSPSLRRSPRVSGAGEAIQESRATLAKGMTGRKQRLCCEQCLVGRGSQGEGPLLSVEGNTAFVACRRQKKGRSGCVCRDTQSITLLKILAPLLTLRGEQCSIDGTKKMLKRILLF